VPFRETVSALGPGSHGIQTTTAWACCQVWTRPEYCRPVHVKHSSAAGVLTVWSSPGTPGSATAEPRAVTLMFAGCLVIAGWFGVMGPTTGQVHGRRGR